MKQLLLNFGCKNCNQMALTIIKNRPGKYVMNALGT